jgi:hypothetical protein
MFRQTVPDEALASGCARAQFPPLVVGAIARVGSTSPPASCRGVRQYHVFSGFQTPHAYRPTVRCTNNAMAVGSADPTWAPPRGPVTVSTPGDHVTMNARRPSSRSAPTRSCARQPRCEGARSSTRQDTVGPSRRTTIPRTTTAIARRPARSLGGDPDQ